MIPGKGGRLEFLYLFQYLLGNSERSLVWCRGGSRNGEGWAPLNENYKFQIFQVSKFKFQIFIKLPQLQIWETSKFTSFHL